jgi:cyclopropane fatty-acyl-phospholipid synthase-like methyltransferase
MKEFWDERYKQESFAFGEEPNLYFKEQIEKFNPGELLLPAEGEGRNAVYAAQLGWKVSAFDISIEGKNKAEKLAKKNHVFIHYEVGELKDLHYSEGQFDAIALIYAHFPENIRHSYHQIFDKLLKKNGVIILEAFSKNHLTYNAKNENVGGPRQETLLYSLEEIQRDFNHYEFIELQEIEVELNEGLYHVGLGSVIRFTGIKK